LSTRGKRRAVKFKDKFQKKTEREGRRGQTCQEGNTGEERCHFEVNGRKRARGATTKPEKNSKKVKKKEGGAGFYFTRKGGQVGGSGKTFEVSEGGGPNMMR